MVEFLLGAAAGSTVAVIAERLVGNYLAKVEAKIKADMIAAQFNSKLKVEAVAAAVMAKIKVDAETAMQAAETEVAKIEKII